MTDIYLVIVNDRHADIEVTPFTMKDTAIAFAEEQAEANALDHDDWDRELTDGMIADGWVWYCNYSCEGDDVAVVRRELRTGVTGD